MPDDDKLHNVDEDDAPESDDNSGPTGATAMPDWLNLPREVVPASTELDLEDGELNLDWDMLADVLADAPVVRTGATSNAGSVGRANTEVDSDEDDEMSYDRSKVGLAACAYERKTLAENGGLDVELDLSVCAEPRGCSPRAASSRARPPRHRLRRPRGGGA